MIFIRELAKTLKISQVRLSRIKYFEKNIVSKKEIEELKDFFVQKNTNYGLIKARKIEKLLKNLENEVA